MKPTTVNRKAKELLDNGKIAARIKVLQQRQVKRHDVTMDSITEELEEARGIAKITLQPSAMVSASLGKAKLHGLLVDKNEVTGKDGNPSRSRMQRQLSCADLFRTLPPQEQRKRIEALTDAEAQALLCDWSWHARPNQLLPSGSWISWLIPAGRGFGKTRTGAETVRHWIKKYPYVNLIGARRRARHHDRGRVRHPCHLPQRRTTRIRQAAASLASNGAKSLIFTADEPERLRGKQHMNLWADEQCAWRYPEASDQASLGLRLGDSPQAIITTTPKPTKQLRESVADPTTVITKGSTYDNLQNLAEAFLTKIHHQVRGHAARTAGAERRDRPLRHVRSPDRR